MAWIGVAFAVGIGFVSRSWSLLSLAVGFTLIRMFGQGSLTLVSIVAVTKWVTTRRGAALGLLSTLGGALMGLVPVGLNQLIAWTDWRTAWLISGVVVLVSVPTIAVAGFSGRREQGDKRDDDHTKGPPDTDRSSAIRTYRFWVLGMAVAAAGMFVTALSFHQISLLGEAGLTAAEAAAMFIPQVLGAAAAAYLFGWLSDRWPARTLIMATMALLGGALGMTMLLAEGWLVVAYSLVLGASGGSLRSVSAALPPRWFGIGHIGSIQGVMTFFGVFASSAGPLYLSLGRDVLGRYQAIALVSIAVPAAIALAAAAIREPAAELAAT